MGEQRACGGMVVMVTAQKALKKRLFFFFFGLGSLLCFLLVALSAQILPNHQLLEQVENPPVGLAPAGPLLLVENVSQQTSISFPRFWRKGADQVPITIRQLAIIATAINIHRENQRANPMTAPGST